jgi:hypothetical protein
MSNGNWKIEGNQLIITLDLSSKQISKTGKSYLLASSGGFQYEGDIGVSFNVIRKK